MDAAGERLAEARAQVERSGERWCGAELHRLLGGVLESFTEGHDTADLRAAQTQLSLIQPPTGD